MDGQGGSEASSEDGDASESVGPGPGLPSLGEPSSSSREVVAPEVGPGETEPNAIPPQDSDPSEPNLHASEVRAEGDPESPEALRMAIRLAELKLEAKRLSPGCSFIGGALARPTRR